MGAGMLVLRLHDPQALRTTLTYRDPNGWTFSEDAVIDDRGLTITSTDYDADGQPVKTTTRHLRASCAVVDAELAKYPT